MNTVLATLAAAHLSAASVSVDVSTSRFAIQHAEIVSMVKPAYPEFARKLQMEGSVVVRVQVGKDGKAKQALIAQSTSPLFEKVALEAAMTAEYSPATMPAGPVPSWVDIPFTFKCAR